MFILYSILGGVLYVVGDVLGKYWALNNNWWYFAIGLALYASGGIFMFYAIREDSLTMALLVLPAIAITGSLLAGYFVFDERISAVQYMAGAVILAAVFVLMWNPKL